MMNRSDEALQGVIDEIVEGIIALGLAAPDEIEGCTPDEIEEVEKRFALRLPGIYRAYLARLGRREGEFLIGSDFGYPTILTLREAAEELLAENNATITLPANAFVFLMHQGYQFLFFHADGVNDDPPVYWYMELSNEFVEHAPSFSAQLRRTLEDYRRHRSRSWDD